MADDIRVKIKAVDEASGILERLGQRLEKLGVPATKTGKSMGGIGQRSAEIERAARGGAVKELTDQYDKLARATFSAFNNLSRLSGEMGGLSSLAAGGGIAATLAGAVALTRNWAVAGVNLGNSAANIGMAASQLERYRRVAAQVGVSPDAVTGALGAAQSDIFQSRFNPNVASSLRLLGINTTDANGAMRSPQDVLGDMADYIGKFSPAGQMQAAASLGLPPDALPLLRKGSGWIKSQLAATAAVPGMGDNAYDGAAKLNEDLAKLDTSVIGLTNVIGQNLAPPLDDLVRWLTGTAGFMSKWGQNSPTITGSMGTGWLSTPFDMLNSAGTGLYRTIFGGGSATRSGGSGAALPSEMQARRNQAMAYFIGQGWTPEQAAGIVGNIQGESSFNTAAQNQGHIGIAQWDADRRQKILAGTGIDVANATYDQQLAAIQWELKNNESRAGAALAGAQSAGAAATIIRNGYERPGFDLADQSRRMGYAEDALTGYSTGQAAAANGQVTVNINHNNAPEGSSLDAAAIGSAAIGALKITKAMPGSGGAQ